MSSQLYRSRLARRRTTAVNPTFRRATAPSFVETRVNRDLQNVSQDPPATDLQEEPISTPASLPPQADVSSPQFTRTFTPPPTSLDDPPPPPAGSLLGKFGSRTAATPSPAAPAASSPPQLPSEPGEQ